MRIRITFAGPDQYGNLVKRLSEARTVLKDLAGRKGISIEMSDAHDTVMDAHTHLGNAQIISTHECEDTRIEKLKELGIGTAVNEGVVHIEGVDDALLEQQRLILATIPRSGLEVRQQAALNGIQHMLDYWSDHFRHEVKEESSG